jgi:citrate synthase
MFYERNINMAGIEIFEGAVDKGLEGIVACSTAVSSIQDSTLNYRGYTIEDLAANSTFEEVIFLLWNDRLPSALELEKFKTVFYKKLKQK